MVWQLILSLILLTGWWLYPHMHMQNDPPYAIASAFFALAVCSRTLREIQESKKSPSLAKNRSLFLGHNLLILGVFLLGEILQIGILVHLAIWQAASSILCMAIVMMPWIFDRGETNP